MTAFLEAYKDGRPGVYAPKKTFAEVGASCLAPIEIPSEDRNRTSPFPYGGHRFEFRAVGSAQNVSLVNTVLNTMTAEAFKDFADAIEGGKSPKEVAQQSLKDHWKVIFNGNNYDEANQKMLTDAGVWRIDSSVDAICRYSDKKNTDLFSSMGVLTAEECCARQSVLLEHYVGTVEIEANTMIQMLNQHIIPSVTRAGVGPLDDLKKAVKTLEGAMSAIHHEEDEKAKATLARTLRLETMVELREVADAAEAVVPADLWTLATYKDLLFLDQTTE
jgi:glutamine synthetase